MTKKSKIILAIASVIVTVPAIAETTAPKLIGGTTIIQSGSRYGGHDMEDMNTATPGFGGTTGRPQAGSSRSDELKSMENEIKTGAQKKSDAAEALANAKPAQDVSGKGGTQAINAEIDAQGSNKTPQYVRPPKKAPVVFGSTSSFNKQTIQKMEAEAQQKDGQSYQEFLKTIKK